MSTQGWLSWVRNAHPKFDDFHKLSGEKKILKIGQELTEIELRT